MQRSPTDVGRTTREPSAAAATRPPPRYLFSSHDGYGLGHVRRNTLVARALLDLDPDASVTLVTGVRVKPSWLSSPGIEVVQVPPLLKGSDGAYRHETLPFNEALVEREELFCRAVDEHRPDVIVVDRHPYGMAGELRRGLESARSAGSRLVLGLRDVLDEPARMRRELAGAGWDDVADLFDVVLVYGGPLLCDHEAEYGLPVAPRYCGWVVEAGPSRPRDPMLVAVTAGGGGDGGAVFKLGLDLLHLLPEHRIVLVAGPYAEALPGARSLPAHVRARLELRPDVPSCGELFAGAGSVVQMAGYNSTFESLAAGLRPVLVPRRSPRREQAIRATRLSALGLADIVDEGAPADEVAWLLRRPRTLAPGAVEAAGVHLDGASRAAAHIKSLARAAVP